MNIYLVMITDRYAVVSVHQADSDAVAAMMEFRRRSHEPCVLRHGATGRRESRRSAAPRCLTSRASTDYFYWRTS